ncbi:hypothetical protein [Streptomyces sp. NPDC059076]|uniref:hypothetical protein n=1 Tax=unclassified Streptomyces TaxID=2593676 RepID=UPI00368A824E
MRSSVQWTGSNTAEVQQAAGTFQDFDRSGIPYERPAFRITPDGSGELWVEADRTWRAIHVGDSVAQPAKPPGPISPIRIYDPVGAVMSPPPVPSRPSPPAPDPTRIIELDDTSPQGGIISGGPLAAVGESGSGCVLPRPGTATAAATPAVAPTAHPQSPRWWAVRAQFRRRLGI